MFVTSVIGGTLMEIPVVRGQTVAIGAPLFHLDDESERAARDEARARLQQAEHQLTDLLTGKRPPEIAAIEAAARAGPGGGAPVGIRNSSGRSACALRARLRKSSSRMRAPSATATRRG